ncbi:MAG: glpK [Acidimicrobiaceae bacterium]|nr:glpK [Acidimicrobiaceae bacterium]
MPELVGAIDQGTTSTRFMVFDPAGREVVRHQVEHRQLLPRPGWVEHDPEELWSATSAVVTEGMRSAGLKASDLAAVGLANQRETTVVWDRRSGQPLANAIVWQDTRTADLAARLEEEAGGLFRERSGLMPSTYFSGPKLRWLLDHVEGARAGAERGEVLFGTVDSWLVWKLTGGRHHVIDVTNASRTMLMDLEGLEWDEELCALLGIPRATLPEIRPSSDSSGDVVTAGGPFGEGLPVAAALGDQHAAMVGQACFSVGEAKSTYGTGTFLLCNTGEQIVRSGSGLLSTVCYQLAGEAPRYALEGSVAVSGSAVQWLRDQLGVIADAAGVEELARTVPDAAGLYFVPAFSGLFAPYWRSDARGAIVGMSRYHGAAHLARATLEAICYQTCDLVEAMAADGAGVKVLKVDGGVTENELCMQLQADVLGLTVVRPKVAETTALGAAYAAGLAVGLWDGTDTLAQNWVEDRRWAPSWDEARRTEGLAGWHKAVERTLSWVEPDADVP